MDVRTMTQPDVGQSAVRPGRWSDDWPVAVTAAGVAALVWCLVTQVASVDLAVREGSGVREVNLVSVVVTALVVALAGAGFLRVLQRRTRRGLAIWTVVAVVVLVLSLVGPAGAVSWSAGLGLAMLHLVVGMMVIVGLHIRHGRRVA